MTTSLLQSKIVDGNLWICFAVVARKILLFLAKLFSTSFAHVMGMAFCINAIHNVVHNVILGSW